MEQGDMVRIVGGFVQQNPYWEVRRFEHSLGKEEDYLGFTWWKSLPSRRTTRV